MSRGNGCLKATFHIKYGPEALFERVHYKMDSVKSVEMTSRCVEQARQQRIPQEVLDRVETFGSVSPLDVDDWELVACEVRMDTGKFVTSTWTTEYAGEEYWLTIGQENLAERISQKKKRRRRGKSRQAWGFLQLCEGGQPRAHGRRAAYDSLILS